MLEETSEDVALRVFSVRVSFQAIGKLSSLEEDPTLPMVLRHSLGPAIKGVISAVTQTSLDLVVLFIYLKKQHENYGF